MEYEDITLEVGEDRVGLITLNRPEQLNTFTSRMAEELDNALQEADEDPAVRVLLIRGAGKMFCAGIDLNEYPGKSAAEYRNWVERMEKPFSTIARISTPVIAQVHGVAAANGAGLAAAADIAVAADDARIGLTAVKVGLNCVGPVVPVARCVGRKKALELLLYGELISAQSALEMGLFNTLVPAGELETEGRRWAAELAQRSPLAVQNAKRAFYTAEDMSYDQAFQFMNEAFARLCTTEDAAEGIAAFKEKRTPEWKER
jgi:enoyl-CoA hydratase/carnithine racemase